MKKEISSHAQAAKQIRAELKKEFPCVKFKVTAKTYAGGDSIRIIWQNSISPQQLETIYHKLNTFLQRERLQTMYIIHILKN